ncbi:MAG: hypothetical protein ACRC2B_02690, partial [Rubrivivax sp.]
AFGHVWLLGPLRCWIKPVVAMRMIGTRGKRVAGIAATVGVGVGVGVALAAAAAAAVSVALRAAGTRLAARVTGGWIAAVGLLMLGWAFRASVA